ncbi:DarT ssDNA thymidine ADP-ribosyltransferase family protein [Micromonospora sp. DT231]|uniref:DarT ssDNA thymidine ADP-ribosyltransferase family protein n=1 Tax=Micromonospora sp. DT231 TaxID=3416526 RepID=UPI003CEF867D
MSPPGYSPTAAGIERFVREQGITEVLHFTTNLGLLGIVGTGRVFSRRDLPEERYIEHVYRPNCETRKDPHYIGYISMSISRINDWMFETSERWHSADGVWWVALSFAPSILQDPDVLFVTTNNIYPAARRATGIAGLSALFDDQVAGKYSKITKRSPSTHQPNWPTDRQAEVLYPRPLGLDSLRTLYVRDGEHVDEIHGMIAGIPDAANLDRIKIECRPEVFET